MTIDEAIKAMQNIDLVLSVTDSEHEAARMAISALRAQQERENPQPLTLEELRRMDGEVVYIPESEEYFGGMGIVSVSQEMVVDFVDMEDGFWPFDEYGAGWLAYRRKPEEER